MENRRCTDSPQAARSRGAPVHPIFLGIGAALLTTAFYMNTKNGHGEDLIDDGLAAADRFERG